MDEISRITIPPDLRPRDGRFGSGPSRIIPSFVTALADTGTRFLGTSHRRSGVKDVVSSIRTGLSEMYNLPEGYEVALGIGGATAFWDASVFGLIEDRSAHFVCGEFSQKFANAARSAPHLKDPVIYAAEYGDAPDPEEVSGIDTSAYIHNETSTGVMAPFARLGESLVVVDGTSAAGAISFDVPSVDVYYFSPQKALGSEGGLWIALLSPTAIARIDSIAGSPRWIPEFLSLRTALANSRNSQTYNTPALATLFLLDRQIEEVNARGGIDWADETTRITSSFLYDWAKHSTFAEPFVTDEALRSPTVVTLDLCDGTSGDSVSRILRANGILDTESYRKLGRNQLRIATFPNVPLADVQALTASIDYVVEHL